MNSQKNSNYAAGNVTSEPSFPASIFGGMQQRMAKYFVKAFMCGAVFKIT
jgi:hypothetical protein